MSYIGKTPTAAPLTSSDVADGIISTAKIADTAITNAKLNADIISADTALGAAPADTDELLVSDAGVLKRMDYSHIKASSDYVKIAVTGSGVDAASVSIPIDRATYTSFDVFWHSVPASDDVYLFGVLRNASGTVTASNYKSTYLETRGTSSDGLINSAEEGAEAEFRMAGPGGNADLEGHNLHMIITPHLTSRWGQSGGTYNVGHITWHGHRIDGSDAGRNIVGGGKYDVVIDDITHLDIYYSSGNVAAHNYTIYGRKA